MNSNCLNDFHIVLLVFKSQKKKSGLFFLFIKQEISYSDVLSLCGQNSVLYIDIDADVVFLAAFFPLLDTTLLSTRLVFVCSLFCVRCLYC